MNKRISRRHWLKLMKVISSFLTLMVTLSRLKEAEMMRIKMKNPLLDQTGGSKRRQAGKELELTSAPKEKTSKTTGKSTDGFKSQHKSAGESAHTEEPMHIDKDLEEPAHKDTLAQIEDPCESINELMDTPLDFSAFVINRLKVDTLTPELLAGPTFEPMKGSCKSLVELEYLFEEVYKARNWESARDVYSKRRIIAVTKLQIVDYNHLDWVNVRRDDDKLYTFKETDFNRLRIQDIEDMLLLLVQGKLTNLTIEERLAFNNKDKKNILMRIDELHKFSDGLLDDVWTALNDRLKGIMMQYLPQTIWKQCDKDNARAMIQLIDKPLKKRRIMRSLEKFVGGRPYEGDF
ncbi:hypothetical protein Tco_1412597 [Tanacetum coccineum]